jgi:hypothetical protein
VAQRVAHVVDEMAGEIMGQERVKDLAVDRMVPVATEVGRPTVSEAK